MSTSRKFLLSTDYILMPTSNALIHSFRRPNIKKEYGPEYKVALACPLYDCAASESKDAIHLKKEYYLHKVYRK